MQALKDACILFFACYHRTMASIASIKQKIKDFFGKQKPELKEMLPGDHVRIFLKKPNEVGLQTNTQLTFQRIDEEDLEKGYVEGHLEYIKNHGPITCYELSVYKRKNNKNYLITYTILDEEVKGFELLETKVKNNDKSK